MSTNRREYMREYIRNYRKGILRTPLIKEKYIKIREDKKRGDDLYTLAIRYDYSVTHIWRIVNFK